MLTPEQYNWLNILADMPRQASKSSLKLFCNALYTYLATTDGSCVRLDMNNLLDAMSKASCLLNMEEYTI